MTDASGTVVWAADYKPFGEATITVATITNNLRVPGQYYDAETGLNYNYFRDYNPGTGTYISKDPIGFKGGINLYAYTRNNPVNFTDPFGLDPFIVTVNYWPSKYGSFTMVWNNSLLPSVYTSGTLGANGNIALPFIYTYQYGQHPMNPAPGQDPYPALNVYTPWGTRDIPAFNLNSFWFTYIHGLNVHKGYNQPWSGSQGCHVIPKKNWNSFMSNIPEGSSGLYVNNWIVPFPPFIVP